MSAPVLLLGVLAVLWLTNQLDGTLNRLGAPGLTHACVEADSSLGNAFRCAIYKGEHAAALSAPSESSQGGVITSTQQETQPGPAPRTVAYDAPAKTNLETAQVAEETYSTDNYGRYASDTLSATDSGPLALIEPSLKNPPYVTATAHGTTGYKLVAAADIGNVFTISVNDGMVRRTCTGGGGCVGGTW